MKPAGQTAGVSRLGRRQVGLHWISVKKTVHAYSLTCNNQHVLDAAIACLPKQCSAIRSAAVRGRQMPVLSTEEARALLDNFDAGTAMAAVVR